MIDDLLKLLQDERTGFMKSLLKSEDANARFHLDDLLGKYDVLVELLTVWKEDRLGAERFLTGRRIELEIRMAEEGEADESKTTPERAFWTRKLHDLRLLRSLTTAWQNEVLGLIQYTVDIQE